MKLFETAFWALKALKKSPAGDAPAPVSSEESQTEFISRTADVSAAIPHWNKGLILQRRGDAAGAIAAYRDAIKIVPHYFDAHANLVRLLCETEQWDEAIKHGEMAIRLRRNCPKVHNNLSVAFYHRGQIPKALYHSAAAVQLTPDDADLLENLVDMRRTHPEFERSPVAEDARKIWTQLSQQYFESAMNLFQQRKLTEGVTALRSAVRLAPDRPEAMCQLALILASHPNDTIRNTNEALDLALRAMELGDRSPQYYDALAAAYANAQRFQDARNTIEHILPTVKKKGPLEAAVRLDERLKLYIDRKPLRQEPASFRLGQPRPNNGSTPRPTA